MDNYKVYVHINKVNGKRYYGITKQEVKNRWKNGYSYKFYIDKEGKEHGNKHFWSSICKYGWNEGFEHIVIARGLTEEEAKWLEIELIREHDTTNQDKGYNITKGGESNNGLKHSEESKKKMSESHKGENHPMYGKTLSEEHRKKLSEAHKGKTLSEEHIKKMSESLKGRTHTEETKKKISEANKGHKTSEETRKKLSEAKRKQVYCVELDMYFNSVTEASEFVGCTQNNISRALGKNNSTACGYHWVYAEDVEKIGIENNKVS